MELILAKKSLSQKSNKKIKLEDIESELKKNKQKIYYFDQSNSHKDLVSLVETLEKKGYSVYLREVRYGLDENDYMYEIHIV
jgi:hypothetical protein